LEHQALTTGNSSRDSDSSSSGDVVSEAGNSSSSSGSSGGKRLLVYTFLGGHYDWGSPAQFSKYTLSLNSKYCQRWALVAVRVGVLVAVGGGDGGACQWCAGCCTAAGSSLSGQLRMWCSTQVDVCCRRWNCTWKVFRGDHECNTTVGVGTGEDNRYHQAWCKVGGCTECVMPVIQGHAVV
jgi:hypothetical protein